MPSAFKNCRYCYCFNLPVTDETNASQCDKLTRRYLPDYPLPSKINKNKSKTATVISLCQNIFWVESLDVANFPYYTDALKFDIFVKKIGKKIVPNSHPERERENQIVFSGYWCPSTVQLQTCFITVLCSFHVALYTSNSSSIGSFTSFFLKCRLQLHPKLTYLLVIGGQIKFTLNYLY